MPHTLVQTSLLEKVARDNGFDVPGAHSDDWLAFGSTEVPLRIWLVAREERFFIAFSQPAIADELAPPTGDQGVPLPEGAEAVVTVPDWQVLSRMVRRAWELSATLPNALLLEFELQTFHLPRATEVERLVVQRVGQDLFRTGLLRYWEGRCAVTGLAEPDLLRASHIRPWAECPTDAERLDSNNGLLLAVHLDGLFDKGFITFEERGRIEISSTLSAEARGILGISDQLALSRLTPSHQPYLAWHRERVFRRRSTTQAAGG
jgi:putative restriction endonuclease